MAEEKNCAGGGGQNKPAVATDESLHPPYFATKNGVFQLQSIVGKDFGLLPKGMSAPCSSEEAHAVYREELVETVLKGLRDTCNDHNSPGVYVQGPEGAGKSLLVYTVAQIAKFHLNWITVYVPNCKRWATLGETKAMGFFLDRVVDAFSVSHLQEKFPEFYRSLKPRSWSGRARDFYQKLRGRPQDEHDEARDWFEAAAIDATKVTAMYYAACKFLEERHDLPVLLIFDEVNALWPENKDSVIDKTPWNLATFSAPTLRHGALLVSGTTDCEFILEAIPDGANEVLVSVGPLDARERDALLRTEHFKPIHDLRNIDEELWQTVVDASGNIPRELKKFCLRLKNEIKATKRERSADDSADEEPPSKKLRSVIDDTRSKNRADQKAKLDKALQRDSSGVFKGRLSDSCRSVFIYGTPARVDRTTLRVPNWVISKTGTPMHPTTSDVQTIYFEWFQQNGTNKDKEETALLDTISSTTFTSGERGNALERLLTSKLTRMQNFELKYRLLRINSANEFCTDEMGIDLNVKHRLFKYAADPPDNFQIYPNDTLCTHLDQHGGERRVDLIHYRKDRVVYIEVTVSNYGDAKIPSTEGDARQTAIVGSVRKWLGADTFEVSLETIPSADQGLQKSQKKLVAKYRKGRSRSDRPDPPDLYYIVATTCPRSVKLAPNRTNKFNWIKVSFLEDLIQSEVIPVRLEDSILKAQAKDAGRAKPHGT